MKIGGIDQGLGAGSTVMGPLMTGNPYIEGPPTGKMTSAVQDTASISMEAQNAFAFMQTMEKIALWAAQDKMALSATLTGQTMGNESIRF